MNFISIITSSSFRSCLFLDSQRSVLILKSSEFSFKDAREEGLFRRAGRRDLRRRILHSLKKGEKPQLGNNNNAALECAAALQLFLCHLKKPVMPQHVQELLLGKLNSPQLIVIHIRGIGCREQRYSEFQNYSHVHESDKNVWNNETMRDCLLFSFFRNS